MKKHILIAAAMLASAGLSACGNTGPAGPAGPAGAAASAAAVSLTGVVAKGPISNGKVTIIDAKGIAVGNATTDAYGAYSVSVPLTAVAPFTVKVTGGVDNVTGNKQDFSLTALVFPSVVENSKGVIHANLNAFSTVVAASADAYAAANPGTVIDKSALQKQEAQLVSDLGMGLPAGISPSTDISAGNAMKIVAANEALAEVIRRATKAKAAAGTTVTSLDLENTIAIISADMSDGSLDGYATPTSLTAAVKTMGNTATSKVTVTDVALTTSTTALTAASVVTEVVNSAGSVNVTDLLGTAVPAATVANTLAADTSKAVAKVQTDSNLAIATTARVKAPAPIVITGLVIAPPAAVAVTSQKAAVEAIAVSVANTATQDAYTKADAANTAAMASNQAAVKAALATATVADIRAAATAAKAASLAAVASQTAAATQSQTASAVVTTVTNAGKAPTILQTSAQTNAAKAAKAAKNAVTAQAKVDIAAAKAATLAATNLAAAKTAAVTNAALAKAAAGQAVKDAGLAAQAKIDAAAAKIAAATAAAKAQLAVTRSGIAITGNAITIGGVPVSINNTGAATTAPTVAANNVIVMIPLTDLSKGTQNTKVARLAFSIKSTGDSRIIQGSLYPVAVTTASGVAAPTVNLTGASLTYSGKTRVGTSASGVMLNPNFITVLLTGGIKLDANAFATQAAGVSLAAGTFTYSISITGVKVGFEDQITPGGLSSVFSAVTGKVTVK